jgi:hypothetical protein
MNCLEHCLCQWEQNPGFRMWYNSNHVVIIEPEKGLEGIGYLPLNFYGHEHLIKSFALNEHFSQLLKKYFLNLQ